MEFFSKKDHSKIFRPPNSAPSLRLYACEDMAEVLGSVLKMGLFSSTLHLTACMCFASTFSLRGSFRMAYGILWSGDRLIDPPGSLYGGIECHATPSQNPGRSRGRD